MTLSLTTIADPSLRGCGRIMGAFASPDGSLLAVSSVLPLLNNPGSRAAYGGQSLSNRLGLYRRGETAPFALLDRLRHTVRAVDFHADRPFLLVGAGEYDGGYSFEGELLVWDWETGRTSRPARDLPEVTACRFTAGGIEALVMPWHDEWPEPDGPDEAPDEDYAAQWDYAAGSRYPVSLPWSEADFDRSLELEVTLDPAARLEGEVMSFAAWVQRRAAAEAVVADWLGLPALERRGAIHDLRWLADGRLAVAHEDCHLELFTAQGERLARYAGEGAGQEILHSDPPVVHVAFRPTYGEEKAGRPRRADLFTLGAEGLSPLTTVTGSFTFSAAGDGRLLGRRDRSWDRDEAKDVVVQAADGSVRWIDLGHYDAFNGYLGVDGAPAPYLIRDERRNNLDFEPRPKSVAVLEADDRARVLWPTTEHPGHPAGAGECCAAWLSDASGEALVLGGRFHDHRPFGEVAGFLYRRGVKAGAHQWWRDTAAAPSAIVALPDRGLVVVALLNGLLLVLDAATGETLVEQALRLDGCDTVAFCLDARGDDLAIGTLDGRIALTSLAGVERRPVQGGPRNSFWPRLLRR